jgi:hypothetical protein
MSPTRSPSARAGIRNAALRDVAAVPAAVPPTLQPDTVLQPDTEPDAVPQQSRPGPAQARPRAERPTRITVDLVADLHGFLRGYAQARDVAAADVIRELIRQVRADPDLSARVTAELARRQEVLAEAMRAARELTLPSCGSVAMPVGEWPGRNREAEARSAGGQ